MRSGQLEVNCGRVDDMGYQTETYKKPFQGVDLERKILRREPDLLSQHVGWGWGAMTFGLPLGRRQAIYIDEEGGTDPAPHTSAAMQVGLY